MLDFFYAHLRNQCEFYFVFAVVKEFMWVLVEIKIRFIIPFFLLTFQLGFLEKWPFFIPKILAVYMILGALG